MHSVQLAKELQANFLFAWLIESINPGNEQEDEFKCEQKNREVAQ